jgi:ABC-type Mn2+/Zn2+ transport system ATPase subunit
MTVSTVAVAAQGLELAHGPQPALRDATFEIPAGRITALIGPNGAGKSTLLHAIAGVLTPRRGRLEVPATARRGGVAYVLQATQVNEHLPMTVREAVTLGRYAVTGAIRRLSAADRAAVDDAMAALGISDLGRRQLHELSGGQRQRVFVAQGLAQDADVLLLDEPVTGLDLVSREHILRAITEARDAGRTVILSTHDLGEAANADYVMLLAGYVVAAGAPDEVLTDEALARAYGGRLLRLGDQAVLLDDPHHHAGHAHDGHTGPLGHHGHGH